MSVPLADASYLSLATFRKNGAEVRTPVWFAENDGVIYVFSNGAAGKVKRLRNSSRARVAACDVRGKLAGEWHDATAELITGREDVGLALVALRRKYGWQFGLLDFFAGLFGRRQQREYIAIRLQTT